MRGEFVDLDGARLYYYAAGTRGAGEPVVFLHGFPASGHLWNDVIPLMPAGHRLVVVDLLGYGRSDPPNGRALSLRAHAERVLALLDALGIDRACVVGHDLGGGVAQAMAIHAPARVSRLALVDSVAFAGWPTRDVRFMRALLRLAGDVTPAWVLALLRADLERGYEDPVRAAHSIERFMRPFDSVAGRTAFMQHLHALDAHETRALAQRLSEITAPTAVLSGAHDPFLSLKLGKRLAATIPGATFEVIPGARHFSPEDAPRQIADAIGALLTR
ncbi:MAG: putative hydrolase [Gemmatimonadetes bacterium]|nr:putative hydrolase [Gemmatimonadota bacterium]